MLKYLETITCRVYNETVIIFTSDNGARLLTHGRAQAGTNGPFKCGKGSTYEGGFRVPGIISYPAAIQPGKTPALMSNLDILPTVLGLTGLQSSLLDGVVLDGHDLTGTLVDGKPSPREEIVYIQGSATRQFGKIHALRVGDYKAHFYTEGNILSANEDLDCVDLRRKHSPPLSYNLAHDPGERWRLTELNSDNYQQILEKLDQRRVQLETDLEWAESRHGESGEEAIPCCDKSCQPQPSCCQCQ